MRFAELVGDCLVDGSLLPAPVNRNFKDCGFTAVKPELHRLNPHEPDAIGRIRRKREVGILQQFQIEAVKFGQLQILVGPEDRASEDVSQPVSDLGAALSVDVERSIG